MNRDERAYWIEVAALAIVSAVFFRFGLLLVVFLLPIQIAWVRRGERAGLLTSGLFLVLLACMKLVDYLRIRSEMPTGGAGILFLDMVLPVGFLLGLFLLNTPVLRFPALTGARVLGTSARLAAAMVAAVVIYVPAVILVQVSGAVDTLVAAQTELVRSLLRASNATNEEVVELTQLVLRVFLSGFLFVYLVLLAGTWWIGTRIGLRSRLMAAADNEVSERLRRLSPSSFSLPGWLVWAVVVVLGLLVLTLRVDTGWFEFAARNALLIVLGLYAMQGIAIVWFLLGRRKVSRGGRLGVAIGLIVCLLIPVLNVVVLLGLPCLGISEVWVNYHRFDRSAEQ